MYTLTSAHFTIQHSSYIPHVHLHFITVHFPIQYSSYIPHVHLQFITVQFTIQHSLYIPHVRFNIRKHIQNLHIYIPALCSIAPMSIGPRAIRIYASTHLPTSVADMAISSHRSVLVCTHIHIPSVQYNICRRI